MQMGIIGRRRENYGGVHLIYERGPIQQNGFWWPKETMRWQYIKLFGHKIGSVIGPVQLIQLASSANQESLAKSSSSRENDAA